MKELLGIIFIVCAVALPILIVWLNNRRKINETNQRTQIVLAAIEKNAEADIEDLLKKMAPQKTLLKEKLLKILLWGCLTSFAGIGLIGFGVYLRMGELGGEDDPMAAIFFGLILLAVGIALFINYSVGKRMLAKEIESEEKNQAIGN